MDVDKAYVAWILEQLSAAGGISSRRMFGAVGLYRGDVFFGIISGGTLYFKVDDASRADYESRHMPRFRPYPDRPVVSMGYYEVPADIIEDPEHCVAWALRAVAAGTIKPQKTPKKTPKKKAKKKATKKTQRHGS